MVNFVRGLINEDEEDEEDKQQKENAKVLQPYAHQLVETISNLF